MYRRLFTRTDNIGTTWGNKKVFTHVQISWQDRINMIVLKEYARYMYVLCTMYINQQQSKVKATKISYSRYAERCSRKASHTVYHRGPWAWGNLNQQIRGSVSARILSTLVLCMMSLCIFNSWQTIADTIFFTIHSVNFNFKEIIVKWAWWINWNVEDDFSFTIKYKFHVVILKFNILTIDQCRRNAKWVSPFNHVCIWI